jgi:RNA polymerase sigma-54 factor
VEVLREKHGVEIARRTVAKYRSQLKIPSSSRRKRY